MPQSTTPTLDQVIGAITDAFDLNDLHTAPATDRVYVNGGQISVTIDDGEVTLHISDLPGGWTRSSVTFRDTSLSVIAHCATGIAIERTPA
jgi:hypothetical protein